ncbi:DinB family protein [Flavobacterium sp.]|uniref:DinB family protein n=1 Tax=Flavobacterium sp. TaxID=239 RepID=UPI002488BE55|nr:DinB family protein [Flavobacterium sp.]MDI1317336.1 DinB family protein [Flavobacterium sp.]
MIQKLNLLLDQLESHLEDFEETNPIVSTATIGWQIDHSFLVINEVVIHIKKSNPKEYKWKFNKNRFLVQTLLRKIPRGKVRAPKGVQSFEEITLEYLRRQLEITRNNIAELETLEAKNYFVHPFMGYLNLKTTVDFLELHTKHHLKIIEDILRIS